IGYAAGTGYRRVEHVAGRASLVLLGLVVTIALVVIAARWTARHPARVSAWWERQRSRPFARRFSRQIDFVLARFKPGEVFGLGMTAGLIILTGVGVAFGIVLQDVLAKEELAHIDTPILEALIRHTGADVTRFMGNVSAFGGARFVSIAACVIAA